MLSKYLMKARTKPAKLHHETMSSLECLLTTVASVARLESDGTIKI
jgi:hypothetical protein